MNSLLTGKTTPRRAAPQQRPKANDHAMGEVLRAAGEHLIVSIATTAEKAKATAEAERRAKASVEQRLAQVEAQRASDAQAAAAATVANQRSQDEMRSQIDALSQSAALLRELINDKDAETEQLRREASIAAQQHQAAIAEVRAEATRAAQAAAALRAEPTLIYQPPIKPGAINFETIKDRNGLLSRVVLKADGYEDVAVDIVRGADNRMRDLKIGGNR